jgi:hypothetical protein
MIRVALAVAFVVGAALSPRTADAGWFYLTPEGVKRIDEITRAIAPIPVERDPTTGQHWFRGFLVAVTLPKNPAAGLAHVDAWDEARIVPVDAKYRLYAKPVTLSALWVRGGGAFHTIRDLRDYGGNFDEVYGTPVGSHRYLEHLYTAIDPDGAMGLRPPGRSAQAARPAKLIDGILVDLIRAHQAPPAQRPAVWKKLFGGLPLTEGTWLSNRTLIFNALAQSQLLPYWIAADRQYQLVEHRRGYPMAAEGIAHAMLTFETLPPDRFPRLSQGERAPLVALSHILIGHIQASIPGTFSHAYDDPRLQTLIDRVRADVTTWSFDNDTPDPQTLAAALSRSETELKGLAASPAAGAIVDRTPRVDPSYQARVAFDLFKVTDTVFFVHGLDELVSTLTMYGHTPFWPDPRKKDRLHLRANAVELLDRLANPPRATDARIEAQRRKASEVCRKRLFHVAWSGLRGQRDFALDRLRQAGWGAAEDLTQFVDNMWDMTWRSAEREVVERETPSGPVPESQRAEARAAKIGQDEEFRYSLTALSQIHDLGGSPNAGHAAAAAQVRRYLAAPAASGRSEDDRGKAISALLAQRWRALRDGAGATPTP